MATILVTGANGFLGKNFCLRAFEEGHTLLPVTRSTKDEDIVSAVANADIVFHFAGVNRPETEDEFVIGNVDFTQKICSQIRVCGRVLPMIISSSAQAELDNAYGLSKKAAEDIVFKYGKDVGAPVHVFRLPNVFGKWCKPHYNSAVATFCHNISRGVPIKINDPAIVLRLVYIDDVIDRFLEIITHSSVGAGWAKIAPVYEATVGEIVNLLYGFAETRRNMITAPVGVGLVRALYSTYISYLPSDKFTYSIPLHCDPRGSFVEMLKTQDSGQFSYFTAHPGVTRGEHYHHSKTEKFLVIRGTAHFGFRQVVTGELHEVVIRGGEGQIVETIPGWTHNITNIGEDEMIVMLWANEIFDRARPDTIAMKVKE